MRIIETCSDSAIPSFSQAQEELLFPDVPLTGLDVDPRETIIEPLSVFRTCGPVQNQLSSGKFSFRDVDSSPDWLAGVGELAEGLANRTPPVPMVDKYLELIEGPGANSLDCEVKLTFPVHCSRYIPFDTQCLPTGAALGETQSVCRDVDREWCSDCRDDGGPVSDILHGHTNEATSTKYGTSREVA